MNEPTTFAAGEVSLPLMARRRETVAVRSRFAVLGVGLVIGLGGGAFSGATSNSAAPRGVTPIMFRLEGKLVDALCPDALAPPMIGLAPPDESDGVEAQA